MFSSQSSSSSAASQRRPFRSTQMFQFSSSSQSLSSHQRNSRSPVRSQAPNRDRRKRTNDDNRRHGGGDEDDRLLYDDGGHNVQEVCMAVCIGAGRIGAAYFDPQYGQINIFEDVVESYVTCDILKILLAHVQPTNVIASAKQDEKVMYHLKNLCLSPVSVAQAADVALANNPMDENNLNKPRLTLLRAWDFGFTSCKHRICTVVGNSTESATLSRNATDGQQRKFGRVRGNRDEQMDEDVREAEARLRTAFIINFDASCMVRSLGALLKYLNLKRLGLEHAINASMGSSDVSENAAFRDENIKADGIYAIKKFTLEKTLLIDIGALEGLQIFQQQFHPSVYKAGRSGSKEGLSLFNICDYCRSGPGSVELRRWFLRPSNDIDVLQKRLDAVAYLTDDNNDEIVEAMSKTLQNIRHLTSIFNRFLLSKGNVRDWVSLYKTLTNCYRLGELVRMRENRPQLLTELAESFGPAVQDTYTLVAEIMDFEFSRKENRFVVKPAVDAELDQRKEFFVHLPDHLAAVAREEMMVLDLELIDECNIVYMPLLGYLLTLPHVDEHSSDTGSVYREEGLELVFIADGRAHYKNDATRRLDEEFGDVKFKIIDRETSIMLNVRNVILDQAEPLLKAVHSAAQLDCLISLALAAKNFGWIKPIMTTEDVINIEGGRHPLQEIVDDGDQFMPNPVRSGGLGEHGRNQHQQESPLDNSQALTNIRHVHPVLTPRPKVHLLTGPNASGKSVYLKQVGLLVYMAHVGSFVPAVKAEIGVMDGIFTRLQTLDSVTGGFSSFSIDVRQMASALNHSTARSLILVDEFGKGTCTETGTGLLAASLEFWLDKKDDCPHVFVCSHIYAVLGLLPKSPLLELLTMAIDQKREELTFLYKLVNGTIESSLAVYTAEAAGLPIPTIRRAVEVFDNIKSSTRTRRSGMTEEMYQCQYKRMCQIVEQFMELDLNVPNLPLNEILRDIVNKSNKSTAAPPRANADANGAES